MEGFLGQGRGRNRGGAMFYYVYLLESNGLGSVKHHYVGRTHDVRARLAKHNAGEVAHTAKFGP